MYQNIFDTHAHYDDERFDEDRGALLESLPAKGVVAVVNAASDMKTSASGLALAHRYDYFYCAAGVHPHEAASFAPGDLDAIAGYARDPKVVAVGEIGLDYHYDFSPRDADSQESYGTIKVQKIRAACRPPAETGCAKTAAPASYFLLIV